MWDKIKDGFWVVVSDPKVKAAFWALVGAVVAVVTGLVS